MGGNQHSKASLAEPQEDKESFFKSKDGVWLFTKTWADVTGEPKGVVFVSHGVGEHVLRQGYVDLAAHFNKAGLVVFGMEHQGHGRSRGERMYAPSFQSYVDHFWEFAQLKADVYPGLPRFLFAHSMGSLIGATMVIQQAEANPTFFKAVVLSALPVLIDPKLDTPTKRRLAKSLNSIAPKWAPPLGKIDPKDLSRSPEAVQRYLDDPLISKGFMKAAQGHGLLQISTFLQENAPKFSNPVLFIHGSQDKLSRPEGSEFFFEQCTSQDKKLRLFEGMFHEMFEDPEKELVFGEIIQFLERVLSGKPPPAQPEVQPETPETKPAVTSKSDDSQLDTQPEQSLEHETQDETF